MSVWPVIFGLLAAGYAASYALHIRTKYSSANKTAASAVWLLAAAVLVMAVTVCWTSR